MIDPVLLLRLAVAKFNPHHDRLGRFGSAGAGDGFTSMGGGAGTPKEQAKDAIAAAALSVAATGGRVESMRLAGISYEDKAYGEALDARYKAEAVLRDREMDYARIVEAEAGAHVAVSHDGPPTEFPTAPKSDRTLDAAFAGHTYTPEQLSGFNSYRQDGNVLMNAMLRGPQRGLTPEQALRREAYISPTSEDPWVTSALERNGRNIANIDAAIAAAPPLKADITVLRVITNSAKATNATANPNHLSAALTSRYPGGQGRALVAETFSHIARTWESLVGAEFTDDGFVSTTTSKTQMFKWDKRAGKGNPWPTYVSIKVPKGTKGLWAPKLLDEKEVFVKKEFLLPRGTKFRITKVTPPANWHDQTQGFHIEMEVVPNE